MALFSYRVSHNGIEVASHLADQVSAEISRAAERLGLVMMNLPQRGSDFRVAYETPDPDGRVYLGVIPGVGKAEDTEQAIVQFEGLEENILRIKKDLATHCPSLEPI
ncbi:hypothetical protein HYZ97_04415 [Candidatus Pacearchaeota archaeon]|nr:hypothetical protein [Candidatus Pacearchaeota archaeon]